jgi:predicted nucleic acid-binding protein
LSVFVLDTSVAVAWYLPEEFADVARAWQRRMLRGEVRLVVPSLHYWEFANVLRTYVRRSELDARLAEETYQLHLEAPLGQVEPERRNVLAQSLKYQATAYDAVYIELALSLDAPLLTAERSTTPWVVSLGRHVRAMESEKS